MYEYVDENRIRDHSCHIIDLNKMRSLYLCWQITISLDYTIAQIGKSWRQHESEAA